MKKEHVLVVIVGLFLLSYVLEAVANPLKIELATPYHFLNPEYINTYPFTSALVLIRSLGIFLTPLLFMSFAQGHYAAKGASLLVLISLMQLYALQDIATGAAIVPLEWALSISMGGVALLIPMIWYFILGGLSWLHHSLGGSGEESNKVETEKED